MPGASQTSWSLSGPHWRRSYANVVKEQGKASEVDVTPEDVERSAKAIENFQQTVAKYNEQVPVRSLSD